jgi:phosphate starvation-inducible PhoH-like protein
MFLTRLGFGSKIVVTGDVTQVDLPVGVLSGLRVVESILTGIEDVSFNRLTSHDVVRHKLVGHIVAAYDHYEATQSPSPVAGAVKGPVKQSELADRHRGQRGHRG